MSIGNQNPGASARGAVKAVLDPCCGSRAMWFDKAEPRAVFGDRRHETLTVADRSHRDDGTRTLRAVLEDYAELLGTLPHRTAIRAHRLTERRVWDVLDGKNTRAGDVRVVGV